MLMKKKLIQWFILMVSAFRFAKKKKQQDSAISLPYLLHSIESLPLKSFIACYTGQGLQSLIISGHPTEEQLQEQFRNITLEYHDLIASEQSKAYVALQKQVIRIAGRIMLLNAVFPVYLNNRNEELKKIMSKNGFHFQKEQSEKLLNKLFVAYMKSLYAELSNKEKDVDKLIKEGSSTEQATRETFINNIIAMGKEGYVIDLEKVMTDVYALTLKAYNELMGAKIKAAA